MFHSQLLPSDRFSPMRLMLSGLLHGVVLSLALTLRFSEPIEPLASASHVILLAPSKNTLPRLHPERSPLPAPAASRIERRPFSPPHIARAERAPLEAVLPDQPLASTPLVEARIPAALAPPPLVVGKLSALGTAEPLSVPGRAIRAAGFSSTVSIEEAPAERSPRATAFNSSSRALPDSASSRVIRSAGFDEATIASNSLRQTASSSPTATAVEILSKPRPLYTEEARRLRIEGEVLLEVLFTASGEAQVERILRGLGHGLDEAAVASARNIQFRPAQRAGQPVDQTATVHITFQLAY